MLKLPHHKRKIILAAAIALVLLAGGAWYLYAKQNDSSVNKTPGQYNPGYFNPDKNVPKTDKKSADQPSDNTTAGEKGDSSSSSTTSPGSDVQPKKPVGTFVSNHYPPPNQESSTCSTTPGVMCVIHFTKGNVTKKLGVQTTDKYGNTSWNWTIQGIGLGPGTWKVSAVAINGSKTATAYDALNLVVK